jgi:hypothetical protein
VKVVAANDKPEASKPEPKTSTEVVGAARAEAIRLYNLSGKPTREQSRKVFEHAAIGFSVPRLWSYRLPKKPPRSFRSCSRGR